MSYSFIAVIPAQPGYFVEVEKGVWRHVIAWGFDAHSDTPIPLAVDGAPEYLDSYNIRTPDGQKVHL